MKAETVTVTANGERRTINLPCSISDFLESSGWRATQVVVEHNGRVVPRSELRQIALNEGDKLEVIVPVAGG
jgi:thiamine biosynthesis protein ThiS